MKKVCPGSRNMSAVVSAAREEACDLKYPVSYFKHLHPSIKLTPGQKAFHPPPHRPTLCAQDSTWPAGSCSSESQRNAAASGYAHWDRTAPRS